MVQELNADLEVGRQKLIHKGKVLADDATVESTGVTETEFFVCMITAKPKATTRAPPPTPAPAPTAAAPATASAATAPAPASGAFGWNAHVCLAALLNLINPTTH